MGKRIAGGNETKESSPPSPLHPAVILQMPEKEQRKITLVNTRRNSVYHKCVINLVHHADDSEATDNVGKDTEDSTTDPSTDEPFELNAEQINEKGKAEFPSSPTADFDVSVNSARRLSAIQWHQELEDVAHFHRRRAPKELAVIAASSERRLSAPALSAKQSISGSQPAIQIRSALKRTSLTPEPLSIPEQPVKSTVEESSISLPVSPTKYVVTVRKLPPTAEELEQARLQSTSTRKRSIDQQQNEAIAKAAFAVATDDNRPRTRRRSSAIISAVDTIILTTSIPQEDSGLTDSADF